MTAASDLDKLLQEWTKSHAGSALLEMLDEDRKVISYRPRFVQIAGSVTAAILLQQVYHRWKAQKRRPFYKFTRPCAHPLYREGDSWCEELKFSRREFDTARSKIGVRVGCQAEGAEEALREGIVLYWQDARRRTWYWLNAPLLLERLEEVYGDREEGS